MTAAAAAMETSTTTARLDSSSTVHLMVVITILDGDVTKEDWEAQEIVLEGIIDRFYKSCSRLGLSTEVYREVVNAHYVSMGLIKPPNKQHGESTVEQSGPGLQHC